MGEQAIKLLDMVERTVEGVMYLSKTLCRDAKKHLYLFGVQEIDMIMHINFMEDVSSLCSYDNLNKCRMCDDITKINFVIYMLKQAGRTLAARARNNVFAVEEFDIELLHKQISIIEREICVSDSAVRVIPTETSQYLATAKMLLRDIHARYSEIRKKIIIKPPTRLVSIFDL